MIELVGASVHLDARRRVVCQKRVQSAQRRARCAATAWRQTAGPNATRALAGGEAQQRKPFQFSLNFLQSESKFLSDYSQSHYSSILDHEQINLINSHLGSDRTRSYGATV